MRLPWQKPARERVDPGRPHQYQSKSDEGIAALAPIGGGVGRRVADNAAAGAMTRAAGCAVSGCGRPVDAPIHAPEE